jgi:hypothetical protein
LNFSVKDRKINSIMPTQRTTTRQNSKLKKTTNSQLKSGDDTKGSWHQQLSSQGRRNGKRGGLVDGGGDEIESPYGRLKPPQDNQDNIHHSAVLWYTIRTMADYGTVECISSNSYGKTLHPCRFHIISISGESKNTGMILLLAFLFLSHFSHYASLVLYLRVSAFLR